MQIDKETVVDVQYNVFPPTSNHAKLMLTFAHVPLILFHPISCVCLLFFSLFFFFRLCCYKHENAGYFMLCFFFVKINAITQFFEQVIFVHTFAVRHIQINLQRKRVFSFLFFFHFIVKGVLFSVQFDSMTIGLFAVLSSLKNLVFVFDFDLYIKLVSISFVYLFNFHKFKVFQNLLNVNP